MDVKSVSQHDDQEHQLDLKDDRHNHTQPIPTDALSATDPATRELLREPDLTNVNSNNMERKIKDPVNII